MEYSIDGDGCLVRKTTVAQAGPHVDSKTDTVVTEAQSPGKDALDQIAAYQVSDLFFYVRGKGSNKRESEPTSPSVLSVTHLFRAFPVPFESVQKLPPSQFSGDDLAGIAAKISGASLSKTKAEVAAEEAAAYAASQQSEEGADY